MEILLKKLYQTPLKSSPAIFCFTMPFVLLYFPTYFSPHTDDIYSVIHITSKECRSSESTGLFLFVAATFLADASDAADAATAVDVVAAVAADAETDVTNLKDQNSQNDKMKQQNF